MKRKSSRLGTLLLDRIAQEGLAGDLNEDLHAGRSRAWYWRQVIGAVASRITHDIRAYPYLTFRAVATGWIALSILALPFSDQEFVIWAGSWLALIRPAQYAICGWVVARLHRDHRVAMVAASTMFLLVTNTLRTTFAFWAMGHFSGQSISLRPSQWVVVMVGLILPLFTMLGGLSGRRMVSTPEAR